MKINIVINEPIRSASGGYKIIYQYSNYLVKKNHEISIYYRCRKDVLYSNYAIPFFLKLLIAKCLMHRGVNWFCVDPAIKHKIVTDISNQSIADGDVVVATAADTAYEVSILCSDKGRKYYFIQHFEDWVLGDAKLKETYLLGMKNIVIARWLKRIVDEESKEDSIYIPNGISKDIFYIKNPIKSRASSTVAVMYHEREFKGSQDALQVLEQVKEIHNELHVEMFGIPEKPRDLPEWITYTKNATQEQLLEIYNKSAIFLCTSWSEGFGLTGAESMFCGCALVTTDTLGIREYANDKVARICLPRDIKGLAEAICDLIENNNYRINIATEGNKMIVSQLDYDKSCQNFEKALMKEQ